MKTIILFSCLALCSCTGLDERGTSRGPWLKPWVSPYERSKLADPIMTFSRGPADAAYMHHVRQSREGARGAEGGSGGGCGCN